MKKAKFIIDDIYLIIMVEEAIIESIVNTYDLPQRIKYKVKNIANRRVGELFIGEYDDVYSYVDSLVEKFQEPYEERFFVRIDASAYDILNHELIEDKNFSPENEEDLDGISFNDVLDILESHLDEFTFKLVRQLDYRGKFNVSPEYFIKNISKIQARLEEFVRNNGFLIPRRPVIQIQLSPFSIKFGRRKFNGNPLAFFEAYPKVYSGLSRSELYKLDPGLYGSLKKVGQLELAIPEIDYSTQFQSISSEKIETIVRLYNGNSTKVARKVGISTATAIKYLREYNLKIREMGFVANKLPRGKRSAIIKAHRKCNNATKVAKKLSVSKETVLRYWKAAGLPILPKGNPNGRIA